MPRVVRREVVELRRIELLTSAERLHRTVAFFAVFRDVAAAKTGFWNPNRVNCDTLRYAMIRDNQRWRDFARARVATARSIAYSSQMQRLFLLLWLALSLAAASGPALASLAPDCPMATSSMSGMASHDDVGCCKPTCSPDCAAVCPAAMIPTRSVATTPGDLARQPIELPPMVGLASIERHAADPPPRTTFS